MLSTFFWKKDQPFKTQISRAEMLAALKEKDGLLWVDLEEPSEFESECLVEIFNFHPLAVEDCLVDHSQPKVDEYEEYLFLVMHAAIIRRDDEETEELSTNELDVFLGKNFVVTFHKEPVRTVGAVREMLLRNPDRFMSHGSDFLVHAILDRLVDNYQIVLDEYDDKIDKLEEEIFNDPPHDFLSTVLQVKQDIFTLKRIVSPQRDTINHLTKNATPFIKRKHLIYFRDIYDHLFRVYSMAEGFHDTLTSILQAFFSYSSHKLNEVVKHLTVLATLTMPAVIIASIYGMNFKFMPELGWKFGYPLSLGLALAISVAMLIWMKFKKWF